MSEEVLYDSSWPIPIPRVISWLFLHTSGLFRRRRRGTKAPLGPERRDHALRDSWARYRECHVGGDFLLIYRLADTDEPSGSIYFARVGTHAELFE